MPLRGPGEDDRRVRGGARERVRGDGDDPLPGVAPVRRALHAEVGGCQNSIGVRGVDAQLEEDLPGARPGRRDPPRLPAVVRDQDAEPGSRLVAGGRVAAARPRVDPVRVRLRDRDRARGGRAERVGDGPPRRPAVRRLPDSSAGARHPESPGVGRVDGDPRSQAGVVSPVAGGPPGDRSIGGADRDPRGVRGGGAAARGLQPGGPFPLQPDLRAPDLGRPLPQRPEVVGLEQEAESPLPGVQVGEPFTGTEGSRRGEQEGEDAGRTATKTGEIHAGIVAAGRPAGQ